MNLLLQDLRYAFRSLSRDAGFTAVACLSLALGIGANTAIFTLTNSVLLSTLPVRDAETLAAVYWEDHATKHTDGTTRAMVSYLNYKDLEARNSAFSSLAAYVELTATLEGQHDAPPQPQETMVVSANYFDVLGVKPVLGRSFLPDEDTKYGGNTVAVLSYETWTNLFGASPRALGQTIVLNSIPYTVIGVAPAGFKGTVTVGTPDIVWVPISMYGAIASPPSDLFYRRFRHVIAIGRLKPGVSMEQAAANLDVVGAGLAAEYPWENRGSTFGLCSLGEMARSNLPLSNTITAAVALTAVAALVLAIACLNIGSLLLVRLSKRAKEVAIRTALGASRGRLLHQFLTESLLLSTAGGTAGLLIGMLGSRLLWSLRPASMALDSIEMHFDWRILVFTAAVALATCVLFGLAPALHASAPDLGPLMRTGGRSGAAAWGRHRMRNLLVACEIAIAFVTLTLAGLLIRGTQQARQVDLGFDPRNLSFVSFDFGARRYSDERGLQFLQSVLDTAGNVPGVSTVAASTARSFGGYGGRTLLTEEQDGNPNVVGTITPLNAVSPAYFDAMKIVIEEGRGFTPADRAGTKLVAVISRAMARQFWPGENALGKRFRLRDERGVLREVVGVTHNTVLREIGETPQPIAYVPVSQMFRSRLTLSVRTSPGAKAVLPAVLSRVQTLDPNLAWVRPEDSQQLIARGLWASDTGAVLFGSFGILGTLLAVVGIYGVLADMVAERTNEIGIRMALGGTPGDVLRMVLAQGTKLAMLGICAGLAAALLLTRLIRSLLFNVSPYDGTALGAAAVAFALAASIACWLPAKRAAAMNPVDAIRNE